MQPATTPKELADQLRAVVDDEEFIMRAVRLKFPQYGESGLSHAQPRRRMAPILQVMPVVVQKPLEYVSKESVATTSDGHDHDYRKAMKASSDALLHALNTGHGPSTLRWSMLSTYRPPEQRSEYNRIMARRAQQSLAEKEDAIARRVFRDPCPFCATRADIGCKHQRLA